jgi:RimJ/RimL family protein N-acetyltransferase
MPGTYLLSPAHAEALRGLASHPELTQFAEIARLASEPGIQDFIARQLERRAAGTGHTLVIMDDGELRGLCGLQGIYETDAPELECWIGRPYWSRGYASFAVKMVLELAFKNLELERVRATVPTANSACHRVLEKNGLHPASPHREAGQPVYEITRQEWQARRDGAALAALHPLLAAILEEELRAGNEVVETGSDWPDLESVFVRLKHPFHIRRMPLPDGVVYSESDDPHWWKADYSAGSPRHVLAY